MPNPFTDIDTSTPFGPGLLAAVNDRLRRITAQSGGGGRKPSKPAGGTPTPSTPPSSLPPQVTSPSHVTVTDGTPLPHPNTGILFKPYQLQITTLPSGLPADARISVFAFVGTDPESDEPIQTGLDYNHPWISAKVVGDPIEVWIQLLPTTQTIYFFVVIQADSAPRVFPTASFVYNSVTVPANSGPVISPAPGQFTSISDVSITTAAAQPHETTGVMYKPYDIDVLTPPSGLPSDAFLSLFVYDGPDPATAQHILTGLGYNRPWNGRNMVDVLEVWIEELISPQTVYFFPVVQSLSAKRIVPDSSFVSMSVTVPSLVGATAGHEYADFVTGMSVTFIESRDAGKNPIFVLQSNWTNPTSDDRYGGVQLSIIIVSGIGSAPPRGLATEMEGSTAVRSGPFPMPTAPGFTYRVYFASINKLNQINAVVDGVTPSVDVFIGETIGSAGQERAPFVTGFTGSLNSGFQNADGVDMFSFDGAFTEPTDLTRYAGSEIWYWPFPYSSTNPNNRQLATCPLGITKYQTDEWPIYTTAEAFEIYALSYDAVGRVNTVTASTPKLSGTVTKSASGKLKLATRSDSSEVGAGLSTSGSTLNIPTNGIANSMVQTGAIDNAKLGALAVDAAKLATSAVTSTKIANLAVGTAAIANAAVGTTQIATASVTTALINDCSVSKLTAGSATFAGLVTFTSAFAVQFLTGAPSLMWGLDVQTSYKINLGSKIEMSGNGGTNPYISDVPGGGGGRLTFENIIHTATTGYTPPSGFMLYNNAGQLRIRFASGVDKEVVLI